MICIEYNSKEEYLDAIDEYFPETHAGLKFNNEDCSLSDLMQGMITIARFAGFRVDEEALTFVFDYLKGNL